MISEAQLEKIKEFALTIDWDLAFKGKARGNRHLFRIVKKARELAQNYRAEGSIVEAGAWLHDTNLEKTVIGSTLENKNKVVHFLKEIGLSSEDQQAVMHCIEAHDGRIPATTIEAKIVHDADTLEKMGPLGIVREIWKRAQIGWTTEKIIEHLKTHLRKREGNIYTDSAREKARELNKQLNTFFETIEGQLKE